MIDFTTLYRRYWPDVLRFALYVCGEHAEAEDLTAEAFLRAWMSSSPIRVATVKAYLFMIVRNLYRDRLRRPSPPGPLQDQLPDPRPAPDVSAAQRDELQHLLAALQKLPTDDRAVLAMSAFDEMPYESIASALSLSLSAVKVRIHRARLKLSAEMNREKQRIRT